MERVLKKTLEIKFIYEERKFKETKYWIDLSDEIIAENNKNALNSLQKEAHELTSIFNKISSSLRNR
jgi:hypothetical protein